jgi:serine/threonine protein kinase
MHNVSGNGAPPEKTYAESLEGATLPGDWYVESRIPISDLSPGHNSVCYIVSRGSERAFLKAFDFQDVMLRAQGQLGLDSDATEFDLPKELIKFGEAFSFERDVMNDAKRMRRVINILDSNSNYFVKPGDSASYVPYIVCELADRDIRHCLSSMAQTEVFWRLETAHHVATALKELHGKSITHGDVKMANVLDTSEGRKIGDLGAASRPGVAHNSGFCGDPRYAPPEAVYGYTDPEWSTQHIPIDLFGLGSIVVYMFTGLTMSKLILHKNLDIAHRAPSYGGTWSGTFADVKPYLLESFSSSLVEVQQQLPPPLEGRSDYRGDLMALITDLCSPLPEQRGIKLANGKRDLGLDRVITRVDLMVKSALIRRLRNAS